MLLLPPLSARRIWVPGEPAGPHALWLLSIHRHFLFKPGGTSPLFCTTSPGYPLTSSTVYSPPPRPLPRSTFSRPAFNLKKPSKYCNWKCAALSAIVISATLVILLAYFVGKHPLHPSFPRRPLAQRAVAETPVGTGGPASMAVRAAGRAKPLWSSWLTCTPKL